MVVQADFHPPAPAPGARHPPVDISANADAVQRIPRWGDRISGKEGHTGPMRLAVGPQGMAALPHPRAPVWVGDVVAAVLIVASAFIPFPETHFRPAAAPSHPQHPPRRR